MADSGEGSRHGHYIRQRSEDLRYGDEASSGIPVYSTWTQFSGMPTHSTLESAGKFPWEAFSSSPSGTFGPSAPSVEPGADFLNCPQVLSHSQSSPTILEPDPRPADCSIPGGFSFSEASQEGRDVYAEAMQNWNFSNTYSPFGPTPDVLGKPVLSSLQTDSTSQVSGSAKPSYSDVAKTLNKTKPFQAKEKEETESVKKKIPEPIVRPVRSGVKKPYISRQNSKGHNVLPDDMESRVTPDSRYGLDRFEDVVPSETEKLKSGSLENIPQLNRKNSTSSVSSGTSGIEEIHLSSKTGTSKKEEQSMKRKQDTAKSGPSSSSKSKPFFDPRRIFQTKESKAFSDSKLPESIHANTSTVLNNGKPAYSSKSATLMSDHKKTTDYINNDLSDSKKKTNQNTVNRDGVENRKHENVVQNGKVDKKAKQQASSPMTKTGGTRNSRHRGFLPLQTTFDQEYIDEWLSYMFEKMKSLLSSLWSLLFTVLLLAFGFIAYLVSGCVHMLVWIWNKVYVYIKSKLLKSKYFASRVGDSGAKRKIGLEENIALPSTGDEAMQRLLACKGKDPYSILGLRSDATDDDIRKYYRKQAVLVHPDKNKQPGAEEAFKILGHAFELIGESEKRRLYDIRLQEADKAEAAMKEFNDLLTKLKDKIQEAGNLMRCDNCGGKHKRIPVGRPWYSARFCKRCNIRHSAKEGDVWAETSMLGFLWHYYACMEGKVYDITEWVACKKDFFKHMQPNAHHVFYRIATEGSRDKGGHQQGRSGEAELEDFINHLFHQAMHPESNSTSNQWQQPSSSSSANQNYSSTSGPTQSNKKTRRRKKKH